MGLLSCFSKFLIDISAGCPIWDDTKGFNRAESPVLRLTMSLPPLLRGWYEFKTDNCSFFHPYPSKMCSINVFPLRLLMTEVFFRPFLLMTESSALIYQNGKKISQKPFHPLKTMKQEPIPIWLFISGWRLADGEPPCATPIWIVI